MELGPEPFDSKKGNKIEDEGFSTLFAVVFWLLLIIVFIGYQLIKFVIGLF